MFVHVYGVIRTPVLPQLFACMCNRVSEMYMVTLHCVRTYRVCLTVQLANLSDMWPQEVTAAWEVLLASKFLGKVSSNVIE